MAAASNDSILINVHYPAGEGSCVLRTDQDWDKDVTPFEVAESGAVHRFKVETSEPFIYYKALHRAGTNERWSCGPNRLATAGASRPFDAFPFFEPSSARMTEKRSIRGPEGSWDIRVCLPPGYDENDLHRYPVLYMNDGHNLFFREEAAVGVDWEIQDRLQELDQMTSIEQVIVVGVYPADRMVDYTSDGSSAYARFLAETLIPRVDAEYRTIVGPRATAILGSSLGGVSALACAWSYPERLGMAACLSATFGFGDQLRARILKEPKPDLRIYLDSGWPKDNFEVTRDMRACLISAGFEEGTELLYFSFPGDRHSESDWGDRVHIPFQFFFGQRPASRSRAGKLAGGASAASR